MYIFFVLDLTVRYKVIRSNFLMAVRLSILNPYSYFFLLMYLIRPIEGVISPGKDFQLGPDPSSSSDSQIGSKYITRKHSVIMFTLLYVHTD